MDAQRRGQHVLTPRGANVAWLLAAFASATFACAPAAGPKAPSPHARAVEPGKEVLPFIHDDYPRALAEAKRSHRAIFVDAWAPWCHSCLSMRAFVLTDPSLAPLAERFVWLAIDTEKENNAGFVRRFSNRVWPTLWVVDAEHETAVLKWEGTATAPELVTLLASAQTGDAFTRANQAAARGEIAEAERGYRAVLAAKDSPDRPRAVEALVGLSSTRKDYAACAELAVREGPELPAGTSRATVIAMGLGCARQAKRPDDLIRLLEVAERLARDPDPRTSADDRSALYEEIVEAKSDGGDAAGAKATAQAWARFLEIEAARATTKQARAVFDAHRVGAYLAAHEPERAIPMLEASERDFPEDYNPPARLARVYLEMNLRSAEGGRHPEGATNLRSAEGGRHPEGATNWLEKARAAVERAAARVYGPRSLRVFALAADVAKARGDAAAERAALEQALARTSSAVLTESQRNLRADLEKRLGTLGAVAR